MIILLLLIFALLARIIASTAGKIILVLSALGFLADWVRRRTGHGPRR